MTTANIPRRTLRRVVGRGSLDALPMHHIVLGDGLQVQPTGPLDLLERSLPQRAQESLETVIALAAVAMVTFLFA
jgi:hypothetical protein